MAGLLAAVGLGAISTALASRRSLRLRAVIMAMFVAVTIGGPLSWSVEWLQGMALTSTTDRAYAWLEAHVPRGTPIAIETGVMTLPGNRYPSLVLRSLTERTAEQLVAQKYEEAGGGYSGAKTDAQKHLSKWTKEKWTTSDGKPAERKGGTTRYLQGGQERSWHCLEPDPQLAERMKAAAAEGSFVTPPEIQVGSIADLPANQNFDTIVYCDVLEHIEDDRREITLAASRLKPHGHLVVLCPAHQFLFSPFDKAIGHFRRYSTSMYRRLTPPGLNLVRLTYLDSLGMLLSLANRLILQSGEPTRSQILFWDRCIVPCSRVLDRLSLGKLGKSVLGVWQSSAS